MTQATTQTVVTTIPPMAGASFVTEQQIIEKLLELKGATPLSFVAQTDPRLNKTSRKDKSANPWLGHVVKVAKVNGMGLFFYDAGVLRRLEKEGKSSDEFRKGQAYHMPILTADGKLTALAIHKADAAAVVGWADIVRNKDNSISSVKSTPNTFIVDDMADGQRYYVRFMLKAAIASEYVDTRTDDAVEYDTLAEYLPPKNDYENQGLDDPLKFLTYGIGGMQSMTFGGQTYIVRR